MQIFASIHLHQHKTWETRRVVVGGEFKTLLSTYVNDRVIREFTWVVRCHSVIIFQCTSWKGSITDVDLINIVVELSDSTQSDLVSFFVFNLITHNHQNIHLNGGVPITSNPIRSHFLRAMSWACRCGKEKSGNLLSQNMFSPFIFHIDFSSSSRSHFSINFSSRRKCHHRFFLWKMTTFFAFFPFRYALGKSVTLPVENEKFNWMNEIVFHLHSTRLFLVVFFWWCSFTLFLCSAVCRVWDNFFCCRLFKRVRMTSTGMAKSSTASSSSVREMKRTNEQKNYLPS